MRDIHADFMGECLALRAGRVWGHLEQLLEGAELSRSVASPDIWDI